MILLGRMIRTVSPALLRRYRAERLLRSEFDARREKVLASVRGRLRAGGIVLDMVDLEECYAQAWHGLYAALLEGQPVENPIGWLTLVCYRRAIDEHRARLRERELLDGSIEELAGHVNPDLAAVLDDRMRLRHTFEALRKRLGARERQAASLCYLQGLSRAQAAAQMGISEARMRKLMEGRGPGRPGVAAKVDELLRTIRGDGWCEQQASSMRALAFGILDPEGERYRLAELHRRECPACRAYVLSLRAMAVALPPLTLPVGPLAAFGGALGGGASAGGAATSAGAGGAVGGSSVLAGGSLLAKVATGCLLMAGVGGGCVALIAGSAHTAHAAHRHGIEAGQRSTVSLPDAIGGAGKPPALPARRSSSSSSSSSFSSRRTRRLAPSVGAVAQAGQSQRELGFERAPAPIPTPTSIPTPTPSTSTPSSTPTQTPISSRPRGADGEFAVR
jgi:RNA polymerase sigma factor (sigma-70 family)